MSVAQLDRLIANLETQAQAGSLSDTQEVDVTDLLQNIQSVTGIGHPVTQSKRLEVKNSILQPKLSGNTLEGMCAVWLGPDGNDFIDETAQNDHVARHSWEDHIGQLKATRDSYHRDYLLPLLFFHIPPSKGGLLGKVTELCETEVGVHFSAKLANTDKAREAYELSRLGVMGASYAYDVLDAEYLPHPKKQYTTYRRIKKMAVHEVSVIPNHSGAANPGTNVYAKSLDLSPELQSYIANLKRRHTALDIKSKQLFLYLLEVQRYFDKNFK